MDMEPKSYYEEQKCRKEKRCCVDLALTILLVSFAFVLGLIIGALTAILVLLGLSGFIAVAVILALLIVLRIVALICCKKERNAASL